VVEEIARGWMSVSGVINTHFIVAWMLMHHGTDEQKQSYLPRMATGRGQGRLQHVRAGLRVGRQRHPYEGGPHRRWLRDHRAEDVADQRRLGQPGRRPGEDRRGSRLGLQEHDHVPGREGARLRRDGPRDHHPRQDRQDGLQGRRDHRDGRGHRSRAAVPRRRARQGLLPDDGRRRGGPRQRRARCGVAPGLRARGLATPSSARPSARRSPSTRRCCSGSPRWDTRSRPPTR
jgi:hypothetical protein